MFAVLLALVAAVTSTAADYRRLRIVPTTAAPRFVPPLYADPRPHFRRLILYVDVEMPSGPGYLEASYRVFREDGSWTDVNTGLRQFGTVDAEVANQAIALRVHGQARAALLANAPFTDYREPLFTAPSVVAFTGDSILNFYHEVSIAMPRDELARLDRPFGVETRFKHIQRFGNEARDIAANRFVIAIARPDVLTPDEHEMIRHLEVLTRCEGSLVAN